MTAPAELLLFQVGARVFATAVADVVRVGSVRAVPPDELVEDTSLGATFTRERGLVVADLRQGLEATLVVDQVLGIRQIPREELRPLPAFAAAVLQSAAVCGLVLLDDLPTMLVDLPTLIRERRTALAPT